ncbi:signal transduction histidine kinase [Alteromonadaceae bacterium 2753L.S.0a.02]|nr:signal transduction histidine kinase [Alteromonadaceae bacterium 2753L.S.0a.02]
MVKFTYNSIKFQILIAFSLLTLPVVALAYFFSLSQQIFDKSLDEFIELQDMSYTTGEVERNVIDLQRNVLIFKETSSSSAADKVTHYFQAIAKNLDRLATSDNIKDQAKIISLMREHLEQYHDNFDTVMKLRIQRTELLSLHNEFEENLLSSLLNSSTENVEDIRKSLMTAHAASLTYLSLYDQEYIDSFKRQMASAKQTIAELPEQNATTDEYSSLAIDYEKSFFKIVATTRHYVYLINVVMAGSANEIIHYGQELHSHFVTKANASRHEVSQNMDYQRIWITVVSLLGVTVAGIAAVMFYLRITQPIENITNVFEKLAAGEEVNDISEAHRADEIGKLASAANVFRDRNAQTSRLLAESEVMVKEQKALNLELRAQKKRAEKALSIKSEFLANMSHELRTPLNSIIGFTVRLLKRPDVDPQKQRKSLNAIERNGRHLLAMINDILDLSKIEANKLELNITSLDLNHVCQECVAMLGSDAEEKGLKVIFTVAKVPSVQTDYTRLKQILVNLFSNAIKYTNEGSIRFELEQDFTDKFVSIRISDTGIGISSEDQKRLFHRFEQFDDSTRFQIGKGTGLGLAIVANVGKLLGVHTSVVSDLGQGSTFTVKVPIHFS